MIASPSSRHSVNKSDMGIVSAEAGGGPSSTSAASTSSPAYPNNDVNSTHSQQQQQQFDIDSFDFGADFSLSTSLDELTLFHQQQQQQQQRNTAQSIGGRSSNDGMAESPRTLNFSPRHMMGEQQQHLPNSSASHTNSPHTLSNKGEDGASNTGHLNNIDLHNLLRAVQSSAVQQQQQIHPQQQISMNQNNVENGANMSLSEMEAYLMEKEHAERMQILQTALLRQQLETLQRQQSAPPTDANQSSAVPVNTSQLMQQYQQLMSQQNASTPTPQSMHRATSFHQQPQHGIPDASTFPAQKGIPSSLSQYGLITPLTSNAFVHGHQGTLPFVSPIHLPSSSQMEAHRSYDPNYTPLESPAVTPASVFSNIGSGNTTANSQDLFSPLTSPALQPQVGNVSGEELMLPLASPYLGPMMSKGQVRSRGSKDGGHIGSLSNKKKSTTPSASPAIVATKSVPRKNRSTTAEARANRARPSPLIKPTVATTAATSRKRGDSSAMTSALASPLAMALVNGDSSPQKTAPLKRTSLSEGGKAQTTFPPIHAGTASVKSLGASPSDEGASATPSPIDLDASSSGKPMTPASIMGMNARNSQKAKARKSSDQGKQVSFAASKDGVSSTTSLQSILPGGFPSANREDWLSNKSGSGSSGVGGGGGLESRRTSHKAAEQKRRDSLKYCFDELRGMLPAITLDEDAPGGSSLGPDGFIEDQQEEDFAIEEVGDEESAQHANRAISKVALLRHSNEYLIRLKHRLARRDRDLDFCRKQIMELRSQLGYPLESQQGGVLAQYLHPIDMHQSHFASHNGNHDFAGNNQMDIS